MTIVEPFDKFIFIFPIYSTPKSKISKIIAASAGIGIIVLAGFLVYRYYTRR